MNYDSEITQDILLNMFKKDIIVLPIHDSFIVAGKYLAILTKQMEVSYKKFLKQLPKYDISEPKWRLDFYESLDPAISAPWGTRSIPTFFKIQDTPYPGTNPQRKNTTAPTI